AGFCIWNVEVWLRPPAAGLRPAHAQSRLRVPCSRPSTMILVRYRVAASLIPAAGMGLFAAEPVRAGRVLVAPDAIPGVFSADEVDAHPAGADALAASVRWFEDRFTVSLEWPDECYLNHDFAPNGLWHLGFVFAARD